MSMRRKSTLEIPHAERTSSVTFSAIRNWWNTYQLEKSDTNDSNTEDEEGSAGRKLLSIHLNQTLRTRQLLIDFDAGRPILSLKAPPDLVKFPSISRPRWPIECEVIGDAVHHIEWDPPEPEPFYQPTGHEREPMVAGEERGKVVYCIDEATKHPFFSSSRVGGSRGPIKSATYDISQTEFTLEFESRFESGNLQKAVQVGIYDYELTLRTDMYTKKHTQWFYFRVRNMKAGATFRFTITNLMKSSSLYSHGMRPLLYSEKAAKEEGVGWHRTGSDIAYYRNYSPNSKGKNSDTVPLYSLTWTLQFPYDSDTCYLAHCYPYTYSHLQHYLRRISSNPAVVSYCKLRVLCHSLAGNAVYVLTITSRGGGKVENKTKKAVVVTARVHPGETNGSWMMEGLLDFLLGDSEDAQLLRDTFIFKVVPMLNPDGVVVGNYRCSLAGRDLNRNYRTLLRDSFPCVWHTRNLVKRLVDETDVVLYCDFHGHNRKNNVFMYGCNSQGNASLKPHERIFPLMMSKNASNKFSFKSCKFRVQKSKEGTGRITMWRLGIKNSYTMEATFGGSTLGDRKGTHFTTRDLKSIGFYFCDTLLDYCDPDSTKTTYCLAELTALLRKQVKERLGRDLSTDCKISVSDLETSTSGSNSSDSDGLPAHLLSQPQTVHPEQAPLNEKKKKHLMSRKDRNMLQATRVKSKTQPKVLQKKLQHSESNFPHDNTVQESMQEKPVGKHRKQWQINGLLRKGVIPPSTTHPGEVSQATVWQRYEPVKNDSLKVMKATYHHQGAKGNPYLATCRALTPQTDDPARGMGQRRCPTQLLHLSGVLPSSTNFIHSKQQQSPCVRHFSTSYKVYRGLPHFHRMIPDIVPTNCLLSPFKTDKFNNQNLYTSRKSFKVSEHYFVPEESSISNSESTMTKQKNMELEDFSAGLTRLRSVPYGEQKQGELTPENESSSGLFVPVLSGGDHRGKLVNGKTFGDTNQVGTLSLVPKPPSYPLSRRQEREIRHFENHSGGESRIITTPLEAAVTRASQSAPL